MLALSRNEASHISLEAVGARAGASKGGPLYHSPGKAQLLDALVEHPLHTFTDDRAPRQAVAGALFNFRNDMSDLIESRRFFRAFALPRRRLAKPVRTLLNASS